MVCIHFDGIDREWVIQYRLEGTAVQTVRTASATVRDQHVKEWLAHDKAVASGARFTLTSGGRV